MPKQPRSFFNIPKIWDFETLSQGRHVGYQKKRIELLSKEKRELKLSDATGAPKWRNLANMFFRKLFSLGMWSTKRIVLTS